MDSVEVEKFVRAEYWNLASQGRIPYDLQICPSAPKRIDHRDFEKPSPIPPPQPIPPVKEEDETGD